MFGFIGVGNMGYPLLNSTIKKFGSNSALYYEISNERCEYVKANIGIDPTDNIEKLIKECKYIILSIKPQFFNIVCDQIKENLTSNHILISIAPGITIEKIKLLTYSDIRIIRAMPNTPAMIYEAMTSYCFSNDEFTQDEKDKLDSFFNSFGKQEIVNEDLMDAVVCASGSSPAYVYLFIEALADSVVKYGIPRDKAYKMVAQTVLGAAKMVLDTEEHPGILKDKVCSPGGTTIEGVAALEEHGFRNAIIKATDACYKKAKSIGE